MSPDDHDLLVQINERLTNLISRFDDHLTWSEKQLTLNESSHQTISHRLDALEAWKWKWAGSVAVVVFLLTVLGNLAVKLWSHH